MATIEHLRHANESAFVINQRQREHVARAKSSGFIYVLVKARVRIGVGNVNEFFGLSRRAGDAAIGGNSNNT